jgi:hypothetical protein
VAMHALSFRWTVTLIWNIESKKNKFFSKGAPQLLHNMFKVLMLAIKKQQFFFF